MDCYPDEDHLDVDQERHQQLDSAAFVVLLALTVHHRMRQLQCLQLELVYHSQVNLRKR
jgi:ABC-type transporter Mla MlaB component